MFKAPDLASRDWYRRYFGRGQPDDDWYAGLFPTGTIAGEIAEAYCTLQDDTVHRIRMLYPNLRVIITLRNPIERAISHAKYGLTKKYGTFAKVPSVELIQRIAHPSSRARGAYCSILDTWTRQFQDQLLVLFYDDLREAWQPYLTRVCEFIGVEFAPKYFGDLPAAVFNASEARDVPVEVLEYAALVYQGEIRELAERYGGPALTWNDQARRIVARQSTNLRKHAAGELSFVSNHDGDRWWIPAATAVMVATSKASAASEKARLIKRGLVQMG